MAVVLAFAAPQDRVQGDAQRLMYIHVPVAWTAYLCFAAVLFCGLAYLHTRHHRWDLGSRACAEVGVVLTALTLVTGGIWGQVTWGTWWTWDARLVSTAGLLLVYVGQLSLRQAASDAHRGARWAAIAGIGGFVMVPIVHFSVLWWRTLHQPPTILGPSTSPPIDTMMAVALAAAVTAVMLVSAWVIRRRNAALHAAAAVEAP
ncbi:cytochrome c biogenesis protein CcsA [Phytoactinopolyspora halotolerans]|uniref:Heme exporter protein C n=1 Tax=Phytoactinopolyspora halotolerans TaxID=1981512 RepID=A0A6L9SDC8_9ACTN|nr:cytochrome c biogenesis protein CcsA [Phytoactinopolyspora halotolerans]